MRSKYSPTKGKGTPYHHDSTPTGSHYGYPSHTPKSHKCPKCGSLDIRRSPRRGLIDRLLSLFNFYPYRCAVYSCEHRFRGFGR